MTSQESWPPLFWLPHQTTELSEIEKNYFFSFLSSPLTFLFPRDLKRLVASTKSCCTGTRHKPILDRNFERERGNNLQMN